MRGSVNHFLDVRKYFWWNPHFFSPFAISTRFLYLLWPARQSRALFLVSYLICPSPIPNFQITSVMCVLWWRRERRFCTCMGVRLVRCSPTTLNRTIAVGSVTRTPWWRRYPSCRDGLVETKGAMLPTTNKSLIRKYLADLKRYGRICAHNCP
jgi:hypothetical protein